MSLYGITFVDQLVSAQDHAALQAALLSDGILRGCGMSFSGNRLTMAAGLIISAGRLIGNDAPLSIPVTETSGVARITLVIDLSGVSTEDVFTQVDIRVDHAATAAGLKGLTQQDINGGMASTYELALAVVSLGGSGITAITSRLGAAKVSKEQISFGGITSTDIGLTAEQVRVIKMGTATPTTSTISSGQIYLKYS